MEIKGNNIKELIIMTREGNNIIIHKPKENDVIDISSIENLFKDVKQSNVNYSEPYAEFDSISDLTDELIDEEQKSKEKHKVKRSNKFKYHTKVVKVNNHYYFFTFNNDTNMQVFCIAMKDGFQFASFSRYIEYYNDVLEFDSNTIPIFPSYISFNIGDDMLYYIDNKFKLEYIYVHNNNKYFINQDVFKKVIKHYYDNDKNNTIIYSEYNDEPSINANEVALKESILMINILSKYGYVPNEPFPIDERWFTQFINFDNEDK